MDTGAHHFPQVVGRNIRGHTHGDAGSAVEQHMGHLGGQHHGFFESAVEVGFPVGSTLLQLAQQQLGDARQTRLGIAHGGEGFGVIGRAPVALAVHQRIAVAEGLRHQHHGLVGGAVAVGMEFTDHIAHGARRFLVLGAGFQAQLAHGVDDTALHGLQAVAQMRQGAIHDHVHGIVEVGLLGKFSEGAALHSLQAHFKVIGHTGFALGWRRVLAPAHC